MFNSLLRQRKTSYWEANALDSTPDLPMSLPRMTVNNNKHGGGDKKRKAAACIVIGFLTEDEEMPTRGALILRIKRRREKGAFENICRE